MALLFIAFSGHLDAEITKNSETALIYTKGIVLCMLMKQRKSVFSKEYESPIPVNLLEFSFFLT